MEKKFALVDIKGALLNCGADSAYYAEAVRNIFGLQLGTLDLSKYEGMTAQMAAEAILKENGVQDGMIKEKMVPFLEELQYSYNNYNGMKHLSKTKSIIVDGAEETLKALHSKGVELGVVTGELERIATLNLGRAGILEYFSSGTYGSSGRTYGDILASALGSVRSKHGDVPNSDIFVLSSNAEMISAAKALGLKTIAIPGPKNKNLMGVEADIHAGSIRDMKIIEELTA